MQTTQKVPAIDKAFHFVIGIQGQSVNQQPVIPVIVLHHIYFHHIMCHYSSIFRI